MATKISVVINTLNEEKNLPRALHSVKWVSEIIVCDMHSDDDTVKIAKSFGAKVIYHKKENYVEPARNYALSKTLGEWTLILDADEEIPKELENKIKEIIDNPAAYDYVLIPRKNIIFGKWIKASMWWPDYHIRLFKKDKVVWKNEIHSKPEVQGEGVTVSAEESLAIVHHNYQTISQYISRMNRYSSIQADELSKQNIVFRWKDIIEKPLGEFLSRFFAEKGYLDGLHGLSLSLLQALSLLVVYLKLWEANKFKHEDIKLIEFEQESKNAAKEIVYWIDYSKLSKNPFKRLFQKITYKL